MGKGSNSLDFLPLGGEGRGEDYLEGVILEWKRNQWRGQNIFLGRKNGVVKADGLKNFWWVKNPTKTKNARVESILVF